MIIDKTIISIAFKWLVIFLIGLTVLISTLAYVGYQYFSEKIIKGEREEILSTLQIKVFQIERLIAERHGDAEVFVSHPEVWKSVVNPNQMNISNLKKTIDNLMNAYYYQRVLVFDTSEQLIASSDLDAMCPYDKKGIISAITRRNLVFVDFHSMANEQFSYGVAHPIFSNGDKSAAVVGVAYLEQDAKKTIFPILYSPTGRASEESLLIRREGDDVVFISKLKFKPEAEPLSVRLPFAGDTLAAQGFSEKMKLLNGQDYRGVAVVGGISPIVGTPWVLETKVDRAEIEHLAGIIGLAMGGGALLTTLLLTSIGILWWRNTLLIQKQQYTLDLQRSHTLLAMAEKITRIGSWDYQVATDTVTWSDEMFRILRRDPTTGVPTFAEHSIFFPAEDMARLKVAVQESIINGTHYELDLRILRGDGTVGWGVVLGHAEMGPTGTATRLFGSFQDITERKRNEDLLQLQSEITANAAEGVVSVRAKDGIIVYTNRYFDELFGYSPGELIGQSIVIINAASEQSPEKIAEKIIESLNTTGQWRGEVFNRKKNGSTFWTFASISAYQHPDHGTIWITYQSDISQKKRDQTNLERDATVSLNLLSLSKALISPAAHIRDISNITLSIARLLTDSAHGYVSSIDLATGDNISYTLTKMMENHECNLTGEEKIIIFKKGADGRYPKLWGHALNTCVGFYTNHPAEHPAAGGVPNGHIPLHGFLTVPVLIGDQLIGQIALANPQRPYTDNDLAVIEQIAVIYASSLQRKRIEDELVEKEQRYHTIFENALVGIIRADTNGQFLEVNQEFCRIVGYSREEMLSPDFTFQRITFPEDIESNLVLLRKSLAGEYDSYTIEKRYLRKDGDIAWVILSVYLCRDATGAPMYLLGAAQDINERKRMEQDIIATRDAANASAKAKSEFLANMSHEIRTPMNGVIGLTQLALTQPLSDKVRDYLEKVQLSSHGLLRILNDILDYSKIESGRLTLEYNAFDLEEVLNSLRHLFSHHAEEKNLALFIAIVGNLPCQVMGDSLRLQQILSNLLGNAIKFTEHGSVALSVIFKGMEQSKMQLSFSVIDTGIGMNPQVMGDLFQPFTQADASISRRFGGTGLGLTISRRLLHLLGSEFQVESTLGKGSRFSFELLMSPAPISLDTADTRPRKFQSINHQKLNHPAVAGAHVLLAEDNLINQMVVKELLVQHKMRVTIANNGYEVLAILERERFNVVLMDVHMPKMDGLETTRRLRQDPRFSRLPIIALTASVTEEERERTLACGMDGFLAKPIDPDDFIETLGRYLPQGTVPDDIASLPTPKPSSSLELAGFNLENLTRLMGGDHVIIVDLLRRFCVDVMDTMEKVEVAIAAQDFTNMYYLIHRIKGMAGNAGATDLYTVSTALEKEIKQEGAYSDASLHAFLTAYQTTITVLQTLPSHEASHILPLRTANHEKFQAVVDEIAALLVGRDFVSNDLMSQLEAVIPPERKTIYQQLKKHVQNFDYTQANLVLRQLAGD